MNPERVRKILIAQAAAVIALSFIGSILFLAVDQSDQAAGYDHEHRINLIQLYDEARGAKDIYYFPSHGDTGSLFYVLSLRAVLLFGLHPFSIMLVPFLGWALMLLFGFKLASLLAGGKSLAGWPAASALALSPFVFGLSRKFDPLTLILGLYLATVYAAARFHKTPTPRRAMIYGLWTLAAIVTPVDQTLCMLLIFFAGIPFLLVVLDLLIKRAARPRALAACCLAAAFVVIFGSLEYRIDRPRGFAGYYRLKAAVLKTTFEKQGTAGVLKLWRDEAGGDYDTLKAFLIPKAEYFGPEMERFEKSTGILRSLPGYLLNIFFYDFQPIGFILFLGLFAVFLRLNPSGTARLWALAPAIGLTVLSLIPKKNPWYQAETLVYFPVFAGIALAEIVERAGAKKALAAATLFHAALFGQYVFASTSYEPPNIRALKEAMESLKPICPRVQTVSKEDLRKPVESFLRNYDRLFGNRPEVRLGLAAGPMQGFTQLPYLLRMSGKPLKLSAAAMPDAPELGAGLDAVLFIPSGVCGHTAAVLDDENAFFELYVKQVAFVILHPPRHKNLPASPEDARRRVDSWKSGAVVNLDGGALLFLPREPSATAVP